MSRCVRRAFLCGFDKTSGKDYEHRREWIEARIQIFASVFAVDICSYTVTGNHYHLVVRLSPEQLDELDDAAIAKRWRCLFKGLLLLQKFCSGEQLKSYERDTLSAEIAKYRDRLANMGWMMKCLNEPSARMANKEDGCKGHFWEHRYKSQVLCSDEALLSGMVYTDLSPIRAAMADRPETSDRTSIQHRLNRLQDKPTIDLKQVIAEQCAQGFLLTDQLAIKPLLEFNPDLQTGAFSTSVS